MLLPQGLQDLIDEITCLPGVGPRTAERFAWHLYKTTENKRKSLSLAISNLSSLIKTCPKTFMLISSSEEFSSLYTNPKKNKKQVAVVEQPFDVIALERTANFNGTYHVLGGVINPLEGIGVDNLRIKELIQRIKDDNVEEVILATNSSVEGESTALYIQKLISEDPKIDQTKIKVTRLARGIPIGIDLEYADSITLSHALEGRKDFN
jgi:recombination protein RecR